MKSFDLNQYTVADLLPDPSPVSERHSSVVTSILDVQLETIEARGEQPDSPALPVAGALRGDTPLSSPDKEIK